MKIALVSPYDYAAPGGVVDHIRHLRSNFESLGHQVLVLTPSSDPGVSAADSGVLTFGKVTSVPINDSIARITLSLRLHKRVREVLRRESFDVIHLHEPLFPFLPLTVLGCSETVNVGTFHAYSHAHMPNMAYHYGRRLVQRQVRKLHGRIAVSRCARDFVAQYFQGDYVVIPNGIQLDPEEAAQERAEQYCDERPNILFVGRIEKRKGLRYLLRAYPAIKQRVPGARLIVVGDGRLREAQREYASRFEPGDVVFTGYVPDAEKRRLLRTCQVFCAPSTGQESFGIVLLEAMAAGRPIVASDIPGYRDLVDHGREGLLVPPKDSEALAEAVCRLLLEQELSQVMGRLGRWKAAGYAWPKVAARVLAYYGEVLRRVDTQHLVGARPLALQPIGG